MFDSFRALVKRDLLLAMRRRSDVFTVLLFFIIVVSIFPLGISFEKAILQKIAPGVVWVAALLASTLALERIFANDYADGTLEQILLTAQPLSILVFAKIFAHWLLTGLPLVLIAPLAGLQYHLSATTIGTMMVMLLIGTPILSMIGAFRSIYRFWYMVLGLSKHRCKGMYPCSLIICYYWHFYCWHWCLHLGQLLPHCEYRWNRIYPWQ